MVLEEIVIFFDSLVQTLVSSYGLIGLFLASIIGNATIFFPAPVSVLVFGLGVLAAQTSMGVLFVVLVGVASGAGAAIGELSGYFVGFLGRRGVKRYYSAINQSALFDIGGKIKRHGTIVIFLGALSPLPFDIFGLAAGLTQFDLQKFFLATLFGKVIRDIFIAFAGFYGFELVQAVFL